MEQAKQNRSMGWPLGWAVLTTVHSPCGTQHSWRGSLQEDLFERRWKKTEGKQSWIQELEAAFSWILCLSGITRDRLLKGRRILGCVCPRLVEWPRTQLSPPLCLGLPVCTIPNIFQGLCPVCCPPMLILKPLSPVFTLCDIPEFSLPRASFLFHESHLFDKNALSNFGDRQGLERG